jgi:hypothetical protein
MGSLYITTSAVLFLAIFSSPAARAASRIILSAVALVRGPAIDPDPSLRLRRSPEIDAIAYSVFQKSFGEAILAGSLSEWQSLSVQSGWLSHKLMLWLKEAVLKAKRETSSTAC